MASYKQPALGASSWLRFSLYELMLLVLVIAALLAVLVRPQRQRWAVDELRRLGGSVEYFSGEDASARVFPVETTWLRTLFGEQSVRVGEVDLANNLVSNADLKILGTLKDMRVLRLEGTQISDAALVHLADLTQLETLYLQGTDITNEGLAALIDLPSLRTLHLDNTRVTAEARVYLRRMPKLEHVTMLGLDLNSQDLADPDTVNRKLRYLSRSDVVSDPRLLNEIIQAWQARQDSVRSFNVTCSGTVAERGKAVQMALELVVDSQGRLRLSYQGKAALVRTIYHGQDVSDRNAEGLFDRESIDVFDGKCRTSFDAKSAYLGYPFAVISSRSIEWCYDLRLLPFAIAYRPLQSPDGGVIAKESLAVSQDVATIDGVECIGLYHAEGMVWVSPSRSYLPMRYSEIRRGVTCLDVQLLYARDQEHGWVPSSWKTSSFLQDGTCTQRYEARVDEYRVNGPIADSVFEIAYPPGTLFMNQTDHEKYLLRNDGTRMPILPGEELGDEYADKVREILDSKPDGHSPEASD